MMTLGRTGVRRSEMTQVTLGNVLHLESRLLTRFRLMLLIGLSFLLPKDSSASETVRLPETLRPVRYEIRLQPFIHGNYSVHGRVDIEIEALAPTYRIILHMNDIITKNESSKVTDKESGREIIIIRQLYKSEFDLYFADLQMPLQAGRSYILTLEFVSTLGVHPRGFYRSSYWESGIKSWMASTQFQPTDARKSFPCFDEPDLKTPFKIYLAREENMTALSNMPLVNSTPIADQTGWVWDEFQETPPMSTYLVAFTVSDYSPKVFSEGDNGTLIRVWARETAHSQTTYGGEVAVRALKYLEEFIGVDYLLPKADMICISEMSASAMENWGLMTYWENTLVYTEGSSAAEQKKSVATLVSHELAHQWFGNLVTLDWWDDIWITEGMTTYMENVVVNHFEPSWNMMGQFAVNDQQQTWGIDALRTTHPLRVHINNTVEIFELFDSLSFFKGASLVRMMSHVLTEETFRRGLKKYFITLQYRNAGQDEILTYLQKAGYEDGTLSPDLSLISIMDTWTRKEGFPVVTFARNSDENSSEIRQERFLLDRNASIGDDSPIWRIPITYTTQKNLSFENTRVQFWLNEQRMEAGSIMGYPDSNQWVILNIQQTGYYRVNYDQENWDMLARQLQQDHEVIDVISRAQIIDDALNLARAGQLPYSTALNVISYLSKEKEYVAWRAAFRNLEYIWNMFQQDPAKEPLREFLLSLLLPVYDEVGFEDSPDEPMQTKLLRGHVLDWACQLRHPDCIQRSLRLYRRWTVDPLGFKGMSPNAAGVIKCSAIRNGGKAEYDIAVMKNQWIDLLCSEEGWIASWFLFASFNESSDYGRNGAPSIFCVVAGSSDNNARLAWTYMKLHWQGMVDYVGTAFSALSQIVQCITKKFNSEELLSELKQFERDNSDNLLTAKRAVKQAIEYTTLNVAWLQDYSQDIVSWLKDRGGFPSQA